MTTLDITPERLHELLHYDRVTGIFTWKIDWKHHKAGTQAGIPSGGKGLYLKIYFGGEKNRVYAHRLAWFFVHGVWPQKMIDHIDGNPRNNAIENLRDVGQNINSLNMKRGRKDNKLGILGVFKIHHRYVAQLSINKKCLWLGSYATPEEAHAVYLAAKEKYMRC